MAWRDVTIDDLFMIPSFPSPEFMSSKLNHCWNESRSSKMSGRMKFRSDHSSAKLFCWSAPGFTGMNQLAYMKRCTGQDQSVCTRITLQLSNQSIISPIPSRRKTTHLQSRFFKRCPSSTTIYFHRKPDKNCLSFIQISYVVTTTGKVALVLDPALNAFPLCPALPFPNLPTPAAVGG
jgi:hypothetical protein